MIVRIFIVAMWSAVIVGAAGAAESSRERVLSKAEYAIPNIEGKRLIAVVVDYAPGVKSPPHRHAPSAFIYARVLSGAIRSQVNDEPATVYQTGETWIEAPGARHKISENASTTEPAQLLAIFIVDADEKALAVPAPSEGH